MICDTRGPWIGTATGGRFHLLTPTTSDLNFEDIAISISKICRFNGHLKRRFLWDIYSVAQHSYYVWHLVRNVWGDNESAKWALAHDWPEYAFGDNVSPVKIANPHIKELEDGAAPVFRMKWKIPYNERVASVVKKADLTVGYAEARILQENYEEAWQLGFTPEEDMSAIDPEFRCWTPYTSYRMLTEAFQKEFEA